MTDKDLRRYVPDELDFNPSLAAGDIGVAVADGVVPLTGHVGSYAQKVTAERAVEDRIPAPAWDEPLDRLRPGRPAADRPADSHGDAL